MARTLDHRKRPVDHRRIAKPGHAGLAIQPALVVDWRWYYHLPVAFWTLALPPLVLLKENRRRQAWVILIALVAVMLGGRLLAGLFSMPPGPAESFCMFLTTFATAWTIVWLLGPWLSSVRGLAAFLIALLGNAPRRPAGVLRLLWSEV